MVFAVAGLFLVRIVEGNPLRAGADGINDHTGALRHLNSFGARVRGKIILAVTNENHNAADDVGLVAGRARGMAQLILASNVNGIVDRGSAAGSGAQNMVAQCSGVIREPLDNLRLVV